MSDPGRQRKAVMLVADDERIDVHEAAQILGMSVRNVRRYRERLRGELVSEPVVQPAASVLKLSKAEVLRFKAEREQHSAEENV
jgi:hypothetical protein